jgi:chaperone required for assembly of F1-ATPase
MLCLPTRALAEAIAREWRAQESEIAPVSMPLLRLADTAIDGIAAHRDSVIDAILRFGENDLLCYRADQPPGLGQLQKEAWDPLLDWAARRFALRMAVAVGLVHVDQPPETLAALRDALNAYDAFALGALHVAASITGSLLLTLAVSEGEATPARAFALSRLDEDFQAARWGRDHEAQMRADALARELDKAAEFMAIVRG